MTKIDIKVDKRKHKSSRKFERKVLSQFPTKKKEKKKVLIKVFGVIFILLISLGIFSYYKIYLPAMDLKDSVYVLKDNLFLAKSYVDEQDLVNINSQLDVIEQDLNEVIEKYSYFSFASKIPYIKGYYLNGEHLLTTAELGIPLGRDLLTAATPIADVFGYKTSDVVQEEVSGQEKIETIIRNLPDISSVLASSESQIDEILDNLALIDPNYIPKRVGDIELKSKFEEIDSALNEGKDIFSDIQEVLNLIPEMAGVEEKKTYLILFQNDMELRPTGGFITAFGYAEVEAGRLGEIESEDIYNLDKKIYSWESAPEEIVEYLGQYEWHIRDVNIYSDLVSTSQKFEEMYANQYAPRDFEGIIYIDTEFVEALMSVVGPIELPQYNETITEENVVHELEMYSEKILTGGSDRKQFMEDLMGALVSRVIEARSEEWIDLISAIWSSLESRSLQFYFHNEEIQALAKDYGFTGEIEENVEGDYLYIVESNMGGLKSNFYVESSVNQSIEINDSGDIIKTVKIHWENPEPKDFWLNGPYRNWVRIYVPNGSELISGEVSVRELNTEWNEVDYDKTVFESFVIVPVATGCSYYDDVKDCDPGVFDLEFSYKLPNTIDDDGNYQLYIQKQPGKNTEIQYIDVNGETFEYLLDRDLELEFLVL